MLDVELSSLQSQRHKADRELSLQARAFILRRQFKQRFLKNLTKVFHDDDYWEFQQEYLGLSTADGQRKEAWSVDSPGLRKEGSFLPSLPHGREGEFGMVGKQQHSYNGVSSVKAGRGRKGENPELSNARWSAANANGNPRRGREGKNGVDKDGQREVSLPHIKVSPSQTSPQHSAPSELRHFSPPRKVGFRFQKTSNGITRIFHAHDNVGDDEIQHPTGSDPANPAGPAIVDKNNNENGNDKDTSHISYDRDSSDDNDTSNAKTNDSKDKTNSEALQSTIPKPRPFKNFRRITNPFAERPNSAERENTPAAQPVEEDIHREFPFTTDQPTLDHRFKVLNKLLVKQEPPNDGYIELSPSFPRDGPVNKLQNRIKELHLDVGLAPVLGSRDGSARSFRENLSQGVTPELLSEDDHSDSEADEKEHHVQNLNNAILRLGGM